LTWLNSTARKSATAAPGKTPSPNRGRVACIAPFDAMLKLDKVPLVATAIGILGKIWVRFAKIDLMLQFINQNDFVSRVRAAHIDDPDRFDPRLWRFNAKQARRVAALHAAPELSLGRDNEVLVERIGMGADFDPFAASRNDRENRSPGRDDPHIVLQLRHHQRS
jgi:hypothetical protein